jgi:hypothetical protein
LSDRIVTFEVEDCPEIAPTMNGLAEEDVDKFNPLTPKFRFISPPFARNWSPSARSIASWAVFAEVISAFKLPVPETMNLLVRPETC